MLLNQPTPKLFTDMMGQMEDTLPSARDLNGTYSPKCKTPIAVVGMACRFAGNVTSPAQLWRLCAEGRGSGPMIPENGQVAFESLGSFDEDGHSTQRIENDYSKKEKGLEFDADFFGISADVASVRAIKSARG